MSLALVGFSYTAKHSAGRENLRIAVSRTFTMVTSTVQNMSSLAAPDQSFTSHSGTWGTRATLRQSLHHCIIAKGKYLSPRNNTCSNRRRSQGKLEPGIGSSLATVKPQLLRVGRKTSAQDRVASFPLKALTPPLQSSYVQTSSSRNLLPMLNSLRGLRDPASTAVG